MDNCRKVNISDIERLVKASQGGDRGAFDKLVQLYQRRTMKAAVRMLGDVNEAAEVVQQGFVTAYLKINKLREPKRFGVWLFRIVTNAAVSRQRAAKHRANIITITDSYEDSKMVSSVEKEIAAELKDAIQQAMLKLSKKELKAISLFGLQDLSQAEVAEIMDCSVETVRWYVFRARQKLKVLLKEYL